MLQNFRVDGVTFTVFFATLAAVASIGLAKGIAGLLGFGPLTSHMIVHIALLNVGGLIAGLFASETTRSLWGSRALALSTALQIVLLWGWHAPTVFAAAHSNAATMAAMHISLFVAAAWFWTTVFSVNGNARWMSIAAVLITGKLFCLLAILLAMSPRTLYAASHGSHLHLHSHTDIALADQQLAGLVMIVTCPLIYIVAGVAIAVKWLNEIEHTPVLQDVAFVQRR